MLITSGRLLVVVSLAVAAAPALGAFPAKVFSPYMQVDTGDNMQITNVKTATGQKYFTLAFVIPNSSNAPTWGGTRQSVASGYYSAQINSIRAGGGDVIFSFGGASGGELALTTTDANVLKSKYEAVINKYNAGWLDLDIEGSSVLPNRNANHLRNAALKALQDAYGIQVSYTLPADPNGIDADCIDLLTDAKNKGLKIRNVNAMTMDFGSSFSAGKALSTVCISTANAVKADIDTVDSTIPVGLTCMIGQNDVSTEVFQLSDATALLNFANSKPWINHIGMWSANRDNGTVRDTSANDLHSGIVQSTWDFTNMFKGFSTAVPEPTAVVSIAAILPIALRRQRRR